MWQQVSCAVFQIILNGQLLNRIKVEESLWSLDKGANLVHINLEKTKEIMWKSVFEVNWFLSLICHLLTDIVIQYSFVPL